MAPPTTANFDLTTIAIINGMRYNGGVVSDLMDKLICECSELVLHSNQGRASGEGACLPFLPPPRRCPFFARTLPTPSNFLHNPTSTTPDADKQNKKSKIK